MINDLTITIDCQDCNHRFVITKANIKSFKANISGQSIKVTYCDCPLCLGLNVLQFDNDTTIRMVVGLGKRSMRLGTLRSTNEGLYVKELKGAKKLSDDLTAIRKSLTSQVFNKDVNVDGKLVKLRLNLSVQQWEL